jgi:hypothetical protein
METKRNGQWAMGCVGFTHTADEGRDEGDASLSTGDGLSETEEEGEVAAGHVSEARHGQNPRPCDSLDALLLKGTGGLDTLPGGTDLSSSAMGSSKR